MKKLYTLLFFTLVGLNNFNAATFSSVSSGTWSAPATWAVTGTDADGIPDKDDDVIINTGHNVQLFASINIFRTLVINGGGILTTNTKRLHAYGNFTINGSLSGVVSFQVYANCTLNSTPVLSNGGDWYIQSGTLTISSNTTIQKGNYINVNGGGVVNNGRVILTGGSLSLGSQWINANGSLLSITRNIVGTGLLNAAANTNTVTYNSNSITNIKASTYFNLIVNSASTKSLTGNMNVLNNFVIGTGTSNIINANNFDISVGGNWTNNANTTILNQGTITFNGSGTQTITRSSTEIFKTMVLAGTGTVVLGRNVNINQDLIINSGVLDVSASNFTLNIMGNFVNNGSINCRQGLVTFTGSVPQTISGTQGISFNDLTISNPAGVSVLSNVAVFFKLLVTSGSFGTSGSGIITIPASGPTTYARIGTVSGSLFGNGWVVESYINGPAPKGWQWLSSPMSGATLADWDNDPRFYMSAVGGNDGTALNSQGTGYFYSVRTYNEGSGTYSNVTSTSTPLTAGKGFHIWMADNNTTGLTAPLIYNTTGTPNFGPINFPVTAGGAGTGYNLVGNPYACPITYSAVVAASGNLYSDFIVLQEDNTYATSPNGGIIAPNQGFMCCAISSGNISFTEACKNVNGNPNILKPTVEENAITFSVYNNINGIGGRTFLNFRNGATENFENGTDLVFLASPSEDADNIYSRSIDNIALLRNTLPNTTEDKHIPLTIKSGVYGSHFISAKGLSNLSLYNSVWLEDLTTGKKVDLLKNSEYEFNAEEIGEEYEFIIHFSNRKQLGGNENVTIINALNENTSVYNTPSNVVVKFEMEESTPVTITVFNLAGQKVIDSIQATVTNDRIVLPLQKENSLYLLIIQSDKEQITRKIIY